MAANIQELYQIKNRILAVLIQEARQASGLTPADCADLLGISVESFESFEAGRQSPTLPQLEILAFAFNIPLKHFWGTETLSASRRKDDLKERVPELLMIRQKIIGAKLQELREKAEFTISDVAGKSGVSVERIEALERGQIDIPVSELEVIARAVKSSLDDLTDEHGPVGSWMQAQQEFEDFSKLPPELRAFILRPINRSYVELAVRLSDMRVDQLRTIAESILEITF